MTAAATRPFDVCGPLPTGVTVLEASAGTGKTYTIAALAARYVAQGTPLERLLLVTFTRMATGELRERVRDRLVSVGLGLERVLAGVPSRGTDEVVALLGQAQPAEVRLRCDRLRRALAHFDGATIATTHGFCQEVLSGLGIAGDLEPETVLVEDISELIAEVVDDLYIRRFHGSGAPPFTRGEAAEIARVVIAHPGAPLVQADGPIPQMRRRLALAVRTELELRKRRSGVMTYDDLLTRLDETLGGVGGRAAAARLRARYAVVLVDEFQDTDPIQWDIVRRAFGAGDVADRSIPTEPGAQTHGGTTLVLIGDPKQAIYAFRGADVYAYLAAARAAVAQATLDVNWRSDQGLIDAYDAMFRGAKLGHAGIVYRKVRAPEANQLPRLLGAPRSAPLGIRVLRRDEPTIELTRGGYPTNASAREHIARDLAADLVRLLSRGAEIERRDEEGGTLGREPVCPGHAAVLVRTNRHAALIREALDEVGIPAVINGAGSVFGTGPAREWLRLLEAIERPTQTTRAHAAALTCFLGWSAAKIAGAGDDDWEAVHRRLHDWARVLRLNGVASLTETITLAERLPERLLACADGERRLTDLRHVGQLLHAEASAQQLGVTALTAWLRRRIAEADQDTSDEERSRRLESDAQAVQVLTIHRSKGLEFPVVYLPFLWEPGYIPSDPQPVFFHDADADDALTIDVSLAGDGFAAHKNQSLVEQRGEDLRLAYVALTRAQHQAVLWWAGSWNSRDSPLGRLMFARDDDGNVAALGDRNPADAAATARFEALAVDAPGCIAVERSTLGLPTAWSPSMAEPAALSAAVFDRTLDERWRRTSYTDITAGAYDARVTSEPEEAVVTDEPVALGTAEDGAGDESLFVEEVRGGVLPLGEMPSGAQVGTLVHRVFEATDFAAADLDAELSTQLALAQARRRVEIGDPGVVSAGLRAAIETPLGPLAGGIRLRDLTRGDRLDELDFELPLAGGDEPTGRLTLAAIAGVLGEHLPPDGPLAGYAERLGDPALRRTVRGFLTGSLDLVARVPGPDGMPGFAIVDYKTNWLAGPGEELTPSHHRPAALASEMRRAHYGLQALLYTAALHRYLRWRVADYDAERNLAGVLYLFLRGMTGADTPTVDRQPYGVFAWRPSGALVEALSDVLDGDRAA
ncbi:MAG TPA: UvrD-helicase domain-containing protein [Solirubrobacteraceae bacterium]